MYKWRYQRRPKGLKIEIDVKKLESIYERIVDPTMYDKRLRPNAKIQPAMVNVR